MNYDPYYPANKHEQLPRTGFEHLSPDTYVVQTIPKFWRLRDGIVYPVFGYRNGGELTAPETYVITQDPSELPRAT
jgi:hypothetical protein